MGEFASKTKSKPLEARSFAFELNNEWELLVNIPIDPTPTQIIEEVALVKQPPAELNEVVALVASSPPKGHIMTAVVEPVYQTPSGTKNTPESTVCFMNDLSSRRLVRRPRLLSPATSIPSSSISPTCLKSRRIFSTRSLQRREISSEDASSTRSPSRHLS